MWEDLISSRELREARIRNARRLARAKTRQIKGSASDDKDPIELRAPKRSDGELQNRRRGLHYAKHGRMMAEIRKLQKGECYIVPVSSKKEGRLFARIVSYHLAYTPQIVHTYLFNKQLFVFCLSTQGQTG